jgi:hypothetical protein
MSAGCRHFVLAAAIVAAAWYLALYGKIHAVEPIHSDGYSYYVYVPSLWLYHDPSLQKLANDLHGGRYPEFAGIFKWHGNGPLLNLHPIGTAILMSPFFVVADLLTRWSNLPPDGFSLYYQHGAAIGAIVYFLIGLAILRGMLLEQFTPGVVLATLICLTWGTNLFHYAVVDGTFSHAYAFFLICVWMWIVERWWERPSMPLSLAVGAVAGLNVLVRHTNAIFILVLPLYGITTWNDLRDRVPALLVRWRLLAIAAVSGLVVLSPQLALYKWITGEWVVNSYDAFGMGFHFGSPRVADVLFSTQKGLFFWSPILLLSVFGVFVASGRARAWILPAVTTFALQTWLIASWPQWQFGASFGHRGFTDGFALAAPFLAASFAWASRRRWAAPVFALASAACVLLSVAQMIQYWIGVLPMSDTTWAQYRDVFLRFR